MTLLPAGAINRPHARRRAKRFLLGLTACATGVLLLLTEPVPAQTSFPMLCGTFPTGVQRGKTTEVTVYFGGDGGGNIYGAYKVLFEGGGVSAVIVPPDKGWPPPDPKKPWSVPAVSEVRMRVTVAADAAPGVREYRIAAPMFGISTVGQLVIGDEPEVVETEPNSDLAHAQTIPIPCAVEGRLFQNLDMDYYKFHASAGEGITFAVQCARLEDKVHDLQTHADPMVVLLDAAGKELGENDDYYGADPLLHYRFEQAGDYVLQVRDVSYGGNPYWTYRLTATAGPYVTGLYPCAVRPGIRTNLSVTGFDLGAVQGVVDVPAGTPPGILFTRVTLPAGQSNLVPMLVSNEPQSSIAPVPAPARGAVTASTASAPGNAVRDLAVPGSVSSWLASEHEIDRYRFHARKGQAWGLEITAHRIDSAMDSEIKVRNVQGKVLAENDDFYGKDSYIAWTAPEDGDYTIEVRDITGAAGPSCFYNLTVKPLTPDFELRCDPDRAMLAAGNRTVWFVLVDRKYGFSGPVTIDVRNLPAGVTASALTIPAGVSQGEVILSAAAGAKIDASLAQIVGTGQLAGPDGKPVTVSRTARPVGEIYMPGGGRGAMPLDTQGIAVTQANDIEVNVDTQHVTLAPGGTAKLTVTVSRRSDYNKPVTLDLRLVSPSGVAADPLPPGVTIDDGASKASLSEKESSGYITLRAAPDAKPVQDLPISVLGNVSINFVMRTWFASPLITLTVTPAKK